MTIRSFLIRLILPPLILLIALFAFLLYWDNFTPFVLYASGAVVLLTVIYMTISMFLFSEKVRTPLQQLQDMALSIAAGDHKEHLPFSGPKEIMELGNALTTMSECVQENISRLRESAVLRERMYGEYECALLLQQQMLQQILETYRTDQMHLRVLTFTSASTLHGLLLNIDDQDSQKTEFSLSEAVEKGFPGMFQLLVNPSTRTQYLKVTFDDHAKRMSYQCKHMPEPLVWSTIRSEWVSGKKEYQLEKDDIVLLFNRGLPQCFEDQKLLEEWFQKVLKHFAAEDFDLFITMLQHELNRLTKKHSVEHDIHILCIQKR